MTRPLWQLSACEMREGLRARRFLATEIIESVAGRISTRNGHINAIVDDYTDQALREAEAADAASANGHAIGPLHGIPVTIKTNIDVSGTPTPNGLPIFKDLIAPDDAPVVRNLRQAGAIVIGRTNTPELSMRATTDNPLHGQLIPGRKFGIEVIPQEGGVLKFERTLPKAVSYTHLTMPTILLV